MGKLFGMDFIELSLEDIIRIKGFKHIVTVNNEYIYLFNSNKWFRSTLNDSTYFVCDGRIPFFWSKLKGISIVNATGIDLIEIIYNSRTFKRVLFVGDTENVNHKIVDKFRNSGFCAEGITPEFTVSTDFEEFDYNFDGFEVVFVALGCEKQEKFIYLNKQKLKASGVQVVSGIGGAYRIFLGDYPLPRLVYLSGLGSFWRLFQEFGIKRLKRMILSVRAFIYYLR